MSFVVVNVVFVVAAIFDDIIVDIVVPVSFWSINVNLTFQDVTVMFV